MGLLDPPANSILPPAGINYQAGLPCHSYSLGHEQGAQQDHTHPHTAQDPGPSSRHTAVCSQIKGVEM